MVLEEFIDKYIQELKSAINEYHENLSAGRQDTEVIYRIIRRCIQVMGNELAFDEHNFRWRAWSVEDDAEILLDLLEYNKSKIKGNTINVNNDNLMENAVTTIFISHKSSDKKYGDALRNFIVGLGVPENQLIYTSHPMHKIPLDVSIYEYLRANIHSNMFMIILWSDAYLQSPACLNEMGAAWVVQSDYTNIYVPEFSFGNPKYHECAVDTRKMGAVLNGDEHCKSAMLELKNKIVEMFNLKVSEQKVLFLLDSFINEIS